MLVDMQPHFDTVKTRPKCSSFIKDKHLTPIPCGNPWHGNTLLPL